MVERHEIVARLAAIRERIKDLAEDLSADGLQAIHDEILVLELDVDRKANDPDAPSVDNAQDLLPNRQGEWTVEGAAAFLNVAQADIYKLIEMGQLDVRLRFADLQACEQAQRQRADDD